MSKINPTQEQRKTEQFINWEDRYKRLAAELDNAKKRLAMNSAQEIKQKQDQLLLDMLPLADNFERILNNQVDDPRCSQLMDGIRMTYQNFQNAMKQYGVEPIDALNQPFDPAFHEATALVDHPSQPGGIVIKVIQSGYLREDRLLRPAQVIVSAD